MTRLVFAHTAALLACGMALALARNDGGGGKAKPIDPPPHLESEPQTCPAYIEKIAKVCHEANRAYCASLGDTSQPAWDDAPAWQRSSAINGVAFHLANPEAGDDASHNSWMAEKVAAGWVHGDVKNPDANPPTHPCIVPFDQLPPEQQFKDTLFRSLVHAMRSNYAPLDESGPSPFPAFDVESLSDLLAERLFVKIEALATRDPPAQIAPGSDVPDGSPRNKVLLHLDRIEELLNEDFRTGGDAVIATHVAFGALKRQAIHLPEPAKPT